MERLKCGSLAGVALLLPAVIFVVFQVKHKFDHGARFLFNNNTINSSHGDISGMAKSDYALVVLKTDNRSMDAATQQRSPSQQRRSPDKEGPSMLGKTFPGSVSTWSNRLPAAGTSGNPGIRTEEVDEQKILIMTVAVGRGYREENEWWMRQRDCYAMKHGYMHAVETRNYFQIFQDLGLKESDVGQYFKDKDIKDWYGNHGWRWAWTKAYALLDLLINGGPEGSDFDWVFYADPDVAVVNESISLSKIIHEAKKVAKKSGYEWKDYHMIWDLDISHQESKVDYRAGPTNNDKFLLRRSSASIDFLKNWIAHTDCACWVDQGAFYFEMIRWQGRYLRDFKQFKGPEGFDWKNLSSSCDGNLAPEKQEKARRFLKAHNCERDGAKKSRRCTWTVPAKMTCDCQFINCILRSQKYAGIRLSRARVPHVPPPVYFFNLDEEYSLHSAFHQKKGQGDSVFPEARCMYSSPPNYYIDPPYNKTQRDQGVVFASWKFDRNGSRTQVSITSRSRVYYTEKELDIKSHAQTAGV